MSRYGQPVTHREANSSVPSFREQDDADAISSFPVQLVALMALQSAQKTLESFIHASFASHQRFGSAVNIGNQLYEPLQQLENRAFWRNLDQLLGEVGAFADELADLDVADDRIHRWAGNFDAAVLAARDITRSMANVGNAGDAQRAASDVQTHVNSMVDHSRNVVKRCEREAERVIEDMRSNLAGIFARIESERERFERESRQVKSTPGLSGWGPPTDIGQDDQMNDASRIRESADVHRSRDTQRRWAS